MTRRIVFAAALVVLGTLAGCARTDNPLAPSASRHGAGPRYGDSPTISNSGATSSAAATDSTSTPGGGDVVFTSGGN
jgi:hypothetical protein